MAGITLVGPNPAQPFDIQTQQAQLALAQQIAQGLIAQSLTPGSPIVHTGGNNPFARDVVNLDALGRLGKAYFGNQQMGDINSQQQALAQAFNSQYIQDRAAVNAAMRGDVGAEPDVMGEGGKLAPSDQMGGIEGPSMVPGAQPGSLSRAIDTASLSLNPRIQALADALMTAQIKFAGDQALNPQRLAELGGQYDPRTIAQMQRSGPFGLNYLPGSALGLAQKPVVQETRPGSAPSIIQPSTGQITQGPPNLVPPRITDENLKPAGSPAAGQPGAPGGIKYNIDPSGKVSAVPGPVTDAQVADLKEQTAAARLDQRQLHDFVTEDMTKYQDLIKLSQLAQVQGTTGSFGDQLNDARKIAARIFGFSSDDANKITNFETMMKMALTPAAHAGRQEVGGRYTQLEFMQFLKAGAASGITDPRTAQNIFTDGLLNGFTAVDNHFNNTIPTLEASAGGKGFGDSLKVGIPSSETLADKVLKNISPPTGAQPIMIKHDKELGIWHNEFRANPQQPVGAATPPAQQDFSGFRLVQ